MHRFQRKAKNNQASKSQKVTGAQTGSNRGELKERYPVSLECIGRERELAELERAYELKGSVSAHSFFLCGPRGVGKSCLIREFKRRMRLSGVGVIEVFCRRQTASLEIMANIIMQASVYIDESAPGSIGDTIDVDVSRLIASLQTLGYSRDEVTHREIESGSDRTTALKEKEAFETAVRFLTNVTRVRPPVIVIHNLDRAGTSAIKDIERLITRLSRKYKSPTKKAPFKGLFLLSWRTEKENILLQNLPFWVGGISHGIMNLGGLKRDGVASFLRSESVIDRFTELTGGNPRSLRSLLTWGTPDADEAIKSHMLPISEDAVAIATCCALLDRPTGPTLLRHLTGFNSKRIGASIEELLTSGLMKHSVVTGELQIGFANSGDQDTVIEAAHPKELRKWRIRIAEAFLVQDDKVPAAEHLLAAANGAPLDFSSEHLPRWDVLLQIVLDAGSRLELSGDLERASAMYETTLSLFSSQKSSSNLPPNSDAIDEIALRLALLLELNGHYNAALNVIEAARKQNPKNIEFIRIHGHLTSMKGFLSEAEETLLAGRNSAKELKNTLEEARIIAELCEIALKKGSHERVSSYHTEAISLIDSCPPSSACEELLSSLSLTLGKKAMEEGEPNKGSKHFQEALSRARACSSTTQEIRSLINLGICHLKKGEHLEAQSLYLEALEVGRSGRDARHQAFCLQNLGVLAHWRRDYETALTRFHEAVSVFKKLGNSNILAWLALDLGELYLELGEVSRAEAMSQLSKDLCGEPDQVALEIYRALLDGRLALDSGLFLKGKQQFLRARKMALHAERPEDAGTASIELAGLEAALGNPETALETLRDLQNPPTLKLEALKKKMSAEIRLEKESKSLQTDLLEVLQLFEKVEDPDGQWKTQVLLYRDAQKSGTRAEAGKWRRLAKKTEKSVRSTVPEELLDGYLLSSSRRSYLESVCSNDLDRFEDEIASGKLVSTAHSRNRPATIENSKKEGVCDKASKALNAMVGENPKFLEVLNAIKKVATIESTVLLRGESGTGKELAARAIHAFSNRSAKPLVEVNCGALVETLLLSELFGHEKGAFTGAVKAKKGRFELAEGGTLFLDEIGDISPRTQVALLRVLQEKRFERVGGTESISADVRIVLATNRNLEKMVEEGTFREDLYYRIKSLEIELPPLRERGHDVVLIAREICRRLGEQEGTGQKELSREGEKILLSHTWNGNVRELENVLRSCWVFCEDGEIPGALISRFIHRSTEPTLTNVRSLRSGSGDEQSSHEPTDIEPNRAVTKETRYLSESAPSEETASLTVLDPDAAFDKWYSFIQGKEISLKQMKKRLEKECIHRALEQSDGNITQAAKLLKMKRPRLSQLVKEHGLNEQQ